MNKLTEKEISLLIEKWAEKNYVSFVNGSCGAHTSTRVEKDSLPELVNSCLEIFNAKNNLN